MSPARLAALLTCKRRKNWQGKSLARRCVLRARLSTLIALTSLRSQERKQMGRQSGLREVHRSIRTQEARVVFVAPNIEPSPVRARARPHSRDGAWNTTCLMHSRTYTRLPTHAERRGSGRQGRGFDQGSAHARHSRRLCSLAQPPGQGAGKIYEDECCVRFLVAPPSPRALSLFLSRALPPLSSVCVRMDE